MPMVFSEPDGQPGSLHLACRIVRSSRSGAPGVPTHGATRRSIRARARHEIRMAARDSVPRHSGPVRAGPSSPRHPAGPAGRHGPVSRVVPGGICASIDNCPRATARGRHLPGRRSVRRLRGPLRRRPLPAGEPERGPARISPDLALELPGKLRGRTPRLCGPRLDQAVLRSQVTGTRIGGQRP
jgi:hypothetical protein